MRIGWRADGPDDPIAHTNLAASYLDAASTNMRWANAGAALRVDGGFVPALNNRGIVHAKLGDLARAEADLLEAAARTPSTCGLSIICCWCTALGNARSRARRGGAQPTRRRRRGGTSPEAPSVGGLRSRNGSGRGERFSPAARSVELPCHSPSLPGTRWRCIWRRAGVLRSPLEVEGHGGRRLAAGRVRLPAGRGRRRASGAPDARLRPPGADRAVQAMCFFAIQSVDCRLRNGGRIVGLWRLLRDAIEGY